MMIGLGLLMALIITMGGISYIQSVNMQKSYTHLLESDEEIRYLFKNIEFRLSGISNDQRAYLLNGEEEYLEGISTKEQEVQENLATIKTMAADMIAPEDLGTLEQGLTAYFEVGAKVRNVYKNNPQQALVLHFTEERDLRKENLNPALEKVTASIEQQVKQSIIDIEENNEHTNNVILVTTLVSIVITLMVIIILHKALKPLDQLQISFKRVADGDLTEKIKVTSKDEVGALTVSVNQMIDTLRNTISAIYDSSQQVASSAEELSASSQESTKVTHHLSSLTQNLADATEQQLGKFIAMATTVGDLSQGIQQVHENGEEMDGLSDTAKDAAVAGHTGMTTIVTEMNVIYSSVEETYKIIQGLEEKSAAIENIVSLISNLAEQTNLLALNAAIEAARAGEHGKGFAVVADEVRKLAEESKTSANNVREVLAEVQRETEIAVHSMSNGLDKVTSGIASTHQVNDTFRTIETSIAQLSNKVVEVSNHLRDMSKQSDSVVYFVEEVKSLAESNTTATHESLASTQQQLASSEEILSSAETLARLADQQKSMIAQFKL